MRPLLLEEDICRIFWSMVEELKLRRKLSEFDIYCVSNNQRTSKPWSQAKDKLVGVTKGVADYCVTGIGYMEAKRITRINKDGSYTISKQTPEQKRFEAACVAKGQKYAVFWSAEQGIAILKEWLGGAK